MKTFNELVHSIKRELQSAIEEGQPFEPLPLWETGELLNLLGFKEVRTRQLAHLALMNYSRLTRFGAYDCIIWSDSGKWLFKTKGHPTNEISVIRKQLIKEGEQLLM